MIPEGFAPVEPAAVGRGDHIPVKIGVDKRQIVTVSFNMATAGQLGLIAGESGAEPTITKKLACGVNQAAKSFGLFPVGTDQAGWEVTLTKGQTQRAQVQIPVPALFNVVAEPFRQEAATGHYRFEHGGVVIDAHEFLFVEREPEAAEATEPTAEEAPTTEGAPLAEVEAPTEAAPLAEAEYF